MKYIKIVKNPKFLIITPLKEGDKISKKTLKTVKQNKTKFNWISYTGNNNIPLNTHLALIEYETKFKSLPYIIKIDSHTIWHKNTLDKIYNSIKFSSKNVAYVYTSFDFVNENLDIIYSFRDIKFDEMRLKQSNYISSNSMIKRSYLNECPFIIDNKYVRLLDYAHWLSFLKKKYIGQLSDGYFYSIMKLNNISSGDQQDYEVKLKRVHEDFL